MNKWLQACPLDPLMVRDGRPFSLEPGIRAYTLKDVTPSVMAGTIRTMLAKRRQALLGKSSLLSHFSKLPVRGPLYRWHGSLYFPMPQDAEFFEEDGQVKLQQVVPVRPESFDEEGAGFYGVGTEGKYQKLLWPPIGAGAQKKSSKWPAYVSAKWMQDWLTESLDHSDGEAQMTQWLQNSLTSRLEPGKEPPLFMAAFARQERTQIAIDLDRRMAKDKCLFSTEFLVFPDGMKLEAAIALPEDEPGWAGELSEIHTMGGERRMVHFTEAPDAEASWQTPEVIRTAMTNAKYIRMVLVTPAFFRKGWRPAWLNEELESEVLSGTNVKLRLVWACIPRWQPVSGWSNSDVSGKSREKAVRRLVPAGSVYFFEVLEGDASQLAEQWWLKSVSDLDRRKGSFDQEDGAGLAVWGTWSPDQNCSPMREEQQ